MTRVSGLLGESVRLYRAHASLFAGFAAWALLPAMLGLASELISNDTASTVVALIAFLFEGTAIVWASVSIMRATRALNAGAPVPETTMQVEASTGVSDCACSASAPSKRPRYEPLGVESTA